MNLNFSVFEKLKEIKLDSIVGNFFSLISRIILLLFLFLVVLILLFLILPITLRIYFNHYPITDREYDALAKFVLYCNTIILIIYYGIYLFRKIKFKQDRLKQIKQRYELLNKKRLEKLQRDIESFMNENNESNKNYSQNNESNIQNENENENRIVEINSYIIPDQEVCKKIIIDHVNQFVMPENPKEFTTFHEKKRLELLNHVMKNFDYNYKKAYFHIFIKKDIDIFESS